MVEIGRASHSLRGECGLKSKFVRNVFGNSASLSARRVWIEIISAADEIKKYKSLSARRVWIEMQKPWQYHRDMHVTLCEESVD